MISPFFLGRQGGKKKPHWVSWKSMTQPKRDGGLGFRDMEVFNIALLAKQAWRILTSQSSLCSRMLKAIYFPSVNFLDAEIGSHPSQVWRAIYEGKEAM